MIKEVFITISVLGLLCTSAYARGGKFKEVKIAACEAKEVGSSCSFEGKRGQVEGICTEGRRDSSVILCHDPNRIKEKETDNKINKRIIT